MHVVSDIRPFLLFAAACHATGGLEAPAIFLDFLPIMPELLSKTEFCTERQFGVTQRDSDKTYN